MSASGDKSTSAQADNALATAIREVKNAAADRSDVVIEMREAERMRLDLLAVELFPVIADVPKDVDIFDFAISSGLQPRFWIDAVSHVSMGRDKRTFRFVRDTRLGRVVVAESADMKTVAKQVTRYVAERIVERQRLLEGDVIEVGPGKQKRGSKAVPSDFDPDSNDPFAAEPMATEAVPAAEAAPVSDWRSFGQGLGLVLLGAGAAGIIAISYYWDRLDFSRLGLDGLF